MSLVVGGEGEDDTGAVGSSSSSKCDDRDTIVGTGYTGVMICIRCIFRFLHADHYSFSSFKTVVTHT